MGTELEKLILWLHIHTALYMSVRVYGLDCVEREMRASSRHFRAGLDYTDDCKQTNDFVVESLFFCVFFFLYFCHLYIGFPIVKLPMKAYHLVYIAFHHTKFYRY